MQYDQHCAGCQRAQGLHSIPGAVIGLPGDWSVSHYAGGEGFLGWLALQPRFHRDRLQDLTKAELLALGPNLRALDFGLTEYWKLQFPDDLFQRVYVVYFFEAAFETPPPKEQFHLHIHVIARSGTIGEQLKCTRGGASWVDGWQTPQLTPCGKVPERYSKESPMWAQRVSQLMEYLRHELPPAAPTALG